MNKEPEIKVENGQSHLEKLLQIKQLQINSLLEVTQAINENFTSAALFRIYEFILRAQMGVNRIAVFIYDKEWICVSCSGTEFSDKEFKFPEELLESREIMSLEGKRNKYLRPFDMVIPVYHKDEPLAFSLIGDIRSDSNDSMEEKLKFIQTITNIIHVAIENKKLFKTQLEQAGLKKQLELAAQMQTMLIPHNSMLPNNKSLEMAAVYLPHHDVGGDYYDYIKLNNHESAFCIGDISGKGIPAALLMANFQANLRALISQDHSLEDFIHKLNDKVNEIAKGEKFITLFLGKYNTKTRMLHYVNAGHNPSILIVNKKVELLEQGCTILGMFQKLPFVNVGEVMIEKDAMLVNYTDGLVDMENEKGEYFEVDRLIDFAKENHKLKMEKFNNALLDRIFDFKDKKKFNDDVSILSCRFL